MSRDVMDLCRDYSVWFPALIALKLLVLGLRVLVLLLRRM